MNVLQGLEGWVAGLALVGSRLLVAGNGRAIHVWDTVSQDRDAILLGHDQRGSRNKPLVVSEGRLFYGTFATVKVWSVATLKCEKILNLGAAPCHRCRGPCQEL
jgi:hypothetical protein